ncbi:mandelate racemase/muconate lactonizing enzyme family protein [Alicyclobacillus tolerans]|uniref:mandelate racemase/muconate lactonizing enzyme family protein n=1 Tax=Alicyclobacillus tolerans TaxID=90970 RepID=UPI001F221A50|nr:mandelate racemase/muconate lactonizing enzyme family protein [Alicyclobacillus tolerans]MCF8568513.1 mandelate racemase/muconate lactonizing enzyme family protein [Alicyclobacillus tolerans]
MKIIDVKTRFFGYKPVHAVTNSFGAIKRRTMCLVEVVAEDGTTGYGESWVNFPEWGPKERKATIEEGIRPLLVGTDATQVVGNHDMLMKKLNRIGLQWGSVGAIHQAISGVDLALWDLCGKIRGLPVYKMLGGETKGIPVYASGLGPQVQRDNIMEHMALGIHAFKLKVGFGKDQDLEALRNLRNLVGENASVMVDANQAWTLNQAIQMIDAFQPYNVSWLEEPLRADDMDGYIKLTNQSSIPISAGENLYGRRPFAKWGNSQAIHIAQPDVTKVGGLTEALVITQMMQSWDIRYAPHFLGSIIGLIATCHLFATVPGGMIVELDANENPLRNGVLESPIRIEGGKLSLPDGPGWGIQFSEQKLKEFEIT